MKKTDKKNEVETIEVPADKLRKITFDKLAAEYAGTTHDVGGVAARLKHLASDTGATFLVLFKNAAGLKTVLCGGSSNAFKTIDDCVRFTVLQNEVPVAWADVPAE